MGSEYQKTFSSSPEVKIPSNFFSGVKRPFIVLQGSWELHKLFWSQNNVEAEDPLKLFCGQKISFKSFMRTEDVSKLFKRQKIFKVYCMVRRLFEAPLRTEYFCKLFLSCSTCFGYRRHFYYYSLGEDLFKVSFFKISSMGRQLKHLEKDTF